jgi:hypothetical protein
VDVQRATVQYPCDWSSFLWMQRSKKLLDLLTFLIRVQGEKDIPFCLVLAQFRRWSGRSNKGVCLVFDWLYDCLRAILSHLDNYL